jgi:hypothetical protein
MEPDRRKNGRYDMSGSLEHGYRERMVVGVITGYGPEHSYQLIEVWRLSELQLQFLNRDELPVDTEIFIDRRKYRIESQEREGTSLNVRVAPTETK